jgi:hypothetical protein
LFTEEGLEKTNYVQKAILKRLLTTCDIDFESRDSLGYVQFAGDACYTRSSI